MRVIQQSDPEAVGAATDTLRKGGVLAFPTETSYGLGCDPRNLAALGKIYRIKGRDASKALPLVACSIDQVLSCFDLPPQARDLAEKYWPGPLTILLEPKGMSLRRSLPVFKDGLAAVRVSSHPFVHELARAYGFPITATSANRSRQEPAFSAQEVQAYFAGTSDDLEPDLLIDGGVLTSTQPSTIVRLLPDGKHEIVRQGPIHLV